MRKEKNLRIIIFLNCGDCPTTQFSAKVNKNQVKHENGTILKQKGKKVLVADYKIFFKKIVYNEKWQALDYIPQCIGTSR